MSLPITSSTAPVVEEYDLEVRGSESTFVGLKEASPSHGQIDVGEAQEPGTKHHPKSWSVRRKWTSIGLVSWLCFVSSLASTMFSPAVALMQPEFGVSSNTLGSMTVSIFLFGYVFGSLVAAPMSEQFGRKLVLDFTTAFFAIWQLACALAPNFASLLVFRFLAGLGGSACLSIGSGIISDLFESNDRGKAAAIYALGPLLGPVTGPIVGGFVGEHLGWRWVFWLLSIIALLTLLLQIFAASETNLRVITARRDTFEGRPLRWWHRLDWYGPAQLPTVDGQINVDMKQAVLRPWKLVFTSRIIGLLCLYFGFVYGLLFLLLVNVTRDFVVIYGWTTGNSTLSYIGLAIGFLVGLVLIGSTTDGLMAKHAARNNGIPIPEVRLKVCVYFSILVPLSFWWYGWSAERDAFWLAPVTGLTCFGIGMIGIFLPIQTYLIDAFPENAATATAALASSRSVVGATLPLAGPSLRDSLGLGWGSTVLGFIALVLIPAPFYIARYGTKLRLRNTSGTQGSSYSRK